ncbi:transposase [Nostoc sp.]|uniref:transposase n=1 Tax=Nostoc sp. TaxID=1180 RepID=UPI002FF66971
MPYSSSLSDKEWEIIEPLLPHKKQTRPPKWTKRQILDGIFYQLKNGCNWCDLPCIFTALLNSVLALQAVARDGGARADDDDVAWESARTRKKKLKWTTLLIIDSQAVKNTCNAGVESKGFCHYKCTNGIKRHLAVDTLGLPFFTHCTKASMSDDGGLIELLTQNLEYFRAKPVNIPKITILLDHGYHPDKITTALQILYPRIMTKMRFQLAPKPTKAEKATLGKAGFVPIATRWGKRTLECLDGTM